MKVVASGIDTLVIGFSIESYLDINDFEALTDAKTRQVKSSLTIRAAVWSGSGQNLT